MASHGQRIFGMAVLFGLAVAVPFGSWRHAEGAMWIAAIIGAFVGEAWHRWRTGDKKADPR